MDNVFALESFIDFCDNYQIVTEGSLSNFAKKVWISIQTVIKKLLQILKNLLLNVNYLRTSELPAQKNKDLILVIQNLNPRYEIINKLFTTIYKTAAITNIKYKKRAEELQEEYGPDAKIHVSDAYDELTDEITQSMDDVNSIINDVHSSTEYKRIKEDNYDQSQKTIVPLANVIKVMKKAQTDLINYESNAKKMSLAEENPKSDVQKRAAGKCREIFTKLCEIYRTQISLLKIFFENAKVTVTAVGKNVKEKINHNNDPSRRYSDGNNFLSTAIKRGATTKKVKVTPEQKKQFEELDKIIAECDNKPENFDKYKKAYTGLCTIAKASPDCILIYKIPGGERNGTLPPTKPDEIMFMVLKDNQKPMKLLSNNRLYHTSSNGDLKQLTGRYYHSSLGLRRLWPNQRVYFSIGNAIAKDGSKFNGIDPIARREGKTETSLYKYEPVSHISTVYRDVEMGMGSAVYVPTTTPIPVKKS